MSTQPELATTSSMKPDMDDDAELQRKMEHKLKVVRYLRLTIRLITFAAAIVATGLWGFNLQQYLMTLHDKNGSINLWDPKSVVWPNILNLSVAVFTVFFELIVLTAYFVGKEKVADRWDTARSIVSVSLTVIKIGLLVAAAASVYATRNNPRSLSGQTCGTPTTNPDANQSLFPQLNFDKFCLKQNVGFGLMVASAVTGLMTLITYIVSFSEKSTQKKLERRLTASSVKNEGKSTGDAEKSAPVEATVSNA